MPLKKVSIQRVDEASKMNGMKAIIDKENKSVLIVREDEYEENLIEYIRQHSNVREEDLELFDEVNQA